MRRFVILLSLVAIVAGCSTALARSRQAADGGAAPTAALVRFTDKSWYPSEELVPQDFRGRAQEVAVLQVDPSHPISHKDAIDFGQDWLEQHSPKTPEVSQ